MKIKLLFLFIFIFSFILSTSKIDLHAETNGDPLIVVIPSSSDLNTSCFGSPFSLKGIVPYYSITPIYILYALPGKYLFQTTIEKIKTIVNLLTIKFQSTFILQWSYDS
ncbi:hypothetical protein [Alkalihalobacterium elongatum]|uniref:hypothetical protein n=1 Tax=Alkalihalobacterium elongatum TaxID=2675466 RepID=UPI001C1F6274|nr:hypothetical protein [Alkalihalobacterium elongatum]